MMFAEGGSTTTRDDQSTPLGQPSTWDDVRQSLLGWATQAGNVRREMEEVSKLKETLNEWS